jgi:hypothetical protein
MAAYGSYHCSTPSSHRGWHGSWRSRTQETRLQEDDGGGGLPAAQRPPQRPVIAAGGPTAVGWRISIGPPDVGRGAGGHAASMLGDVGQPAAKLPPQVLTCVCRDADFD